MGTMNDLFSGRENPDPKLQEQQFGFKISGFPQGNPHLNYETQKEAGQIRREEFGPEDGLLNQAGRIAKGSDLDDGALPSNTLQKPTTPAWKKPDPQQRLFDIDTVPEAQPHEQTPDQWLKRDDVMFHTGPQPGEPFDTSRGGTHFGTAEAGMALYGSSKARDVVARRIPGVHDMQTAIDSGNSGWDINDVQYENKVEDVGSVSAHVSPDETLSWVDDQGLHGRFSDYSAQLMGVAAQRQGMVSEWGEYTDDPDTSFRFRSWDTNAASHERRGQRLEEPRTHHQDFLASQESLKWGDPRPTEWRYEWDKMKKWKTR